MNNAEIQIQFPKPGNWQEFTLTAIYPDEEGYTRIDRYQQNDVPEEQAPAMQSVVTALVGLGEDWQAVQVWAHLITATVYNEDDPYTPTGQRDEVALDVEAVNGARGTPVLFTPYQYPEFIISDPAAVEFFNYFTTPNQ